MKLVKSIEIIDIPEKQCYELIHEPDINCYAAHMMGATNIEEVVELRREMVRGQTFRNNRGEEINLGLSSDAYEVLGLPIDCWTKQEKEIKEINNKNKRLEFENELMYDRFEEMERCSFWKRLLYLFKNDLGGLY
jgi:hypothetical protein